MENAEQVLKYVLAGADVVMTTSALLRNGPSYMQTLVKGTAGWLQERGYDSIDAIRGLRCAKNLQNASVLHGCVWSF